MALGNSVPDKTLLRDINKKLLRAGTQTKIVASVNCGCLTLTDTLQFEIQRRPILRAVNQVSGVRRLMDQMTMRPKKRSDPTRELCDSRVGLARIGMSDLRKLIARLLVHPDSRPLLATLTK